MADVPPPPPGAPPSPPPPPGAPPPPPPGADQVPQAATPGDASGRPRWLIPAVVAVVVVLVAGVAGFVILGGDEASADVVLEASGDPGADPFMASMAVREVAEFPSSVEAVIDGTRDSLTSEDGVLVASGTTNALYGGSEDESVCDPATMVAFLEDHEAEAAAWASVVGVEPAGIAAYVNTLTSVILTTDTWVTNHGFADGAATPRQAVLQAGTAVMVDGEGVPRVKCGCGNPLAPPERSDVNVDVGGGWNGFDPAAVTVVQPGAKAENLVVVDVDTGDEFDQPVGARPVTMEDLLNGEYPWHFCTPPEGTVRFTDGWSESEGDTATGDYRSMAIDGANGDVGISAGVGDVDGDDVDEGVVVIDEYCNTGASYLQSVYVLSSSGIMGRLPIDGDFDHLIGGVQVTDDGTIVVAVSDQTTYTVTERAFRWENGEFVEVDLPGSTGAGTPTSGTCDDAEIEALLLAQASSWGMGASVGAYITDIQCSGNYGSGIIAGVSDPGMVMIVERGGSGWEVIEPSGPGQIAEVYCDEAELYGVPIDVWRQIVPRAMDRAMQDAVISACNV